MQNSFPMPRSPLFPVQSFRSQLSRNVWSVRCCYAWSNRRETLQLYGGFNDEPSISQHVSLLSSEVWALSSDNEQLHVNVAEWISTLSQFLIRIFNGYDSYRRTGSWCSTFSCTSDGLIIKLKRHGQCETRSSKSQPNTDFVFRWIGRFSQNTRPSFTRHFGTKFGPWDELLGCKLFRHWKSMCICSGDP